MDDEGADVEEPVEEPAWISARVRAGGSLTLVESPDPGSDCFVPMGFEGSASPNLALSPLLCSLAVDTIGLPSFVTDKISMSESLPSSSEEM